MSNFAANTQTSLTTKYNEFEPHRLTFSPLEENERSKSQIIGYPRYNHPTLGEGQPLVIQSPWMTLDNYGIPSLGEYYKEDKDRAFIKVPLDMNDPEVKKMVDNLEKIDQNIGSDDFKKNSFGKFAKKYKHQPIIRFPEEDEENPRPPYMKLKLDLTWPDNNVKTEVWKSEVLDGKRVRERLPVNTITEAAEHIRYLCKYRCVYRPIKIWAHQQKMKDPGYGIVFKLIKIEVEPNKSSSSAYQTYLQGNVFIDDDDEVEQMSHKTATDTVSEVSNKVVIDSDSSDESVSEVSSKKESSKKESSKKESSKKEVNSESSDESESSDDSESDSENEVSKKKTSSSKKNSA